MKSILIQLTEKEYIKLCNARKAMRCEPSWHAFIIRCCIPKTKHKVKK